MKRIVLLILATMVLAPAFGQGANPFTLSIAPGLDIPLGPKGSDGSRLYGFGGSAALMGEYRLADSSSIVAEGLLDYSIISTKAETRLSLVSLGLGAGLHLDLTEKLKAKLSVVGGYALGIYRGNVGSAPLLQEKVELDYILSPALSFGVGVCYDYYIGLYNGIGVFAGTTFSLGPSSGRSNMEVLEIRLDPVFPVFYSFYDKNALGSVTIKNTEKGTVKDVKVSFIIEQYMDKPKLCAHVREMKKNEEKQVPLYALFTDNILEITEGTKVTASVLVEYAYLDAVITGETSETIELCHRNAMTWDDDRKAASFVTAKDPEILRFSKSIAGEIRNMANKAVNSDFREALGLFEALHEYGINYVVDPSTAYSEFSENRLSIDYLQFPIQTMSYRGGDCDDLSILYAALLESVGIETAFLTVPGHIYVAFCLDVDPETAGKMFPNSENLIVFDSQVWVPVEITMVQDGFLKAMQTGAKEWHECQSEGRAAFYPIHDAWKTYAPVGISDSNARIEEFSKSEVLALYKSELNRFIDWEIGHRVETLQKQIRDSSGKPELINKLGVLYARFGLYDKAKQEFAKASAVDHLPALVNMGNLASLQNEYAVAVEWYNRVLRIEPGNLCALVGIAKAYYELKHHDSAKTAFRKIQELSPSTASRISYLVSKSEETARAFSAKEKEFYLWDEGE